MSKLIGQVTTDMMEDLETYKPLIGREDELNKLIEILNRKEKANPVLIGEAGVGKTAIVEGLVRRIDEGNVPHKLQDARILALNLGTLVQQGSFSGSVEAVVKALCEQIIAENQSGKPIILFVDELHALVDNKGPKQDMVTAFKPYLARGDIRMIGATTRVEYKDIEDDKALERRFTPIVVEEMSIEDTVLVLEGVQEIFETYHEVEYAPGTLTYMAKSADRYLADRSLPDAAIDLMDIVGSKRNLTYPVINTAEYDEQLDVIKQEMYPLISEDRFGEAYSLKTQLNALQEEKRERQEEIKETRRTVIDITDVKHIVEDFLNVEVAVDLSVEDELTRLQTFETQLMSKVIGQEDAVQSVSDAVVSHRLGLRNPNKPVGSFLFYGPSGVGKTELAKQLANILYGDSNKMIRIDMGEYQEPHSISKLLGSPAGYVGYGDGSTAFEPIRKNPNQVVLVDELEKAHPNVQNVFLSILDDGFATDQQNNRINFKETVLIFTTNAKPTKETTTGSIGFGTQKSSDENEKVVRFNEFRPEFLNRFDKIVAFKDLSKDVMKQILELRISDLNELYEESGYVIEFTEPAKNILVEQSMDKGMGARPLNRNLQTLVESSIKERLLSGQRQSEFKYGVEAGEIVLKQATAPIVQATELYGQDEDVQVLAQG